MHRFDRSWIELPSGGPDLTNYAVAFEGTLLFPAKGDMVQWVNYVNHQATARAISIVDDARSS
jgi:hypothetical protein